MESDTSFDFIIVGGGIMGLSAGRSLRLAAPEAKILLLDQFPLPHWRGSSHGHSRIYRIAYHHPVLRSMAAASVKEWRDIEAECGQPLLDNCGILITGLNSHISRTETALKRVGAPYTVCTFDQLCHENQLRAQQLARYPTSQRFLYDPSGGVMFADRCMDALLKFNREHGIVIREGEKVVDIQHAFKESVVNVKTQEKIYSCRSVILTMGPWAPKFLASHLGLQLPIEPRLVGALYWGAQKKVDHGLFRSPNFVPFIDYYAEQRINHMYAVPEREYPGCVKVGHQIGAPVDPDKRELTEFPANILKFLNNYIGNHLPLLDNGKPVIHEPCMYTQSIDGLYVLDRHPRCPGIVIGTGFSGNGFKMGPIVGKILAALTLSRSPDFDLKDFSLQRFGRHQAAL